MIERIGKFIDSIPMSYLFVIEEENRRLRALLKETRSQIHGDCWIREDLQRRIDATLAAEPASGEGQSIPSGISGIDDYAPPPPPTQGEELERKLFYDDRGIYIGDTRAQAIRAALRQRADEATKAEREACALLVLRTRDNIGRDTTYWRWFDQLAAAIRARINPVTSAGNSR